MSLSNLVTLLFFALSLYGFGGGIVEGFQYHAWRLIPAESFPAVHREIELRIERYYVPLLFLSVPVTLLLIWFHHPAMSRNLIVAAAGLQALIVVSTILIAVPIQRQLGVAPSAALVDKLISYHRSMRVGPGLLHLLVVLVLLYQVISGA